MPDNFFAILSDQSIRKIPLTPNVEDAIRGVFLSAGEAFLNDKVREKFDGGNTADDDEIMYVSMELPKELGDIPGNPLGIAELNLKTDQPKALVWYEKDVYYLQNFDSRKMLRHRNVLFHDNQTFDRLDHDAFIIDNAVNAVFQDGSLLFTSYFNANKIFSLLTYFREATNDEVLSIAKHPVISVGNPQWLVDNTTSVIRKHITLLNKLGTLDNLDTTKAMRGAKKFKVEIQLDKNGRIIFPEDTRACRDILYYLNEQYYQGEITSQNYRTNSKTKIS